MDSNAAIDRVVRRANDLIEKLDIEQERAKERQKEHAGTAPGREATLRPELAEVSDGKAVEKAGKAVGRGERGAEGGRGHKKPESETLTQNLGEPIHDAGKAVEKAGAGGCVMTQIPKPMLAGRPGRLEDVRLPVIASPKLDGIRCLIINGRALSRKFKPIPNTAIRTWLEAHCPDGFDGELMVRETEFSGTASGVMSEDGSPDWYFAVFDYVKSELCHPFDRRLDDLGAAIAGIRDPDHRLWMVPQIRVDSMAALQELEQKFVSTGYEGICVRSVDGPYKPGRSTEREGFLLKWKNFDDGEAEVLALEPMLHNDNEAERDAFGRTKRSHVAEGMIELDTLGHFHVRDVVSGLEFDVGTGLNDETRARVWADKSAYIGKLVKYKSQKHGAKELPRVSRLPRPGGPVSGPPANRFKFVVVPTGKRPRYWTYLDDGESVGEIWAEADTLPKLRERLLRSLIGRDARDLGFGRRPQIAFRPQTSKDRRDLARFHRAMIALDEHTKRENSVRVRLTRDGRIVEGETEARMRKAEKAEDEAEGRRVLGVIRAYQMGVDRRPRRRWLFPNGDHVNIRVAGWVEEVLRPFVRDKDDSANVAMLWLLRKLYEDRRADARLSALARKRPRPRSSASATGTSRGA